MAEKRTVIIFVYKDYEYIIKEKGLKSYNGENVLDDHGKDYLFGIQTIDSQGRINFLNDVSAPSQEQIDKIKTDDRFLEICDFTMEYADEKTKRKEVDRFTGTFVDALEYIRDHYFPNSLSKRGDGETGDGRQGDETAI